VRVKTCTDNDTFGVANTLVVDVPTIVGYIVAFEGPTIDEICICDNLTWFFSHRLQSHSRWMTWLTKRIQNLVTNLQMLVQQNA
jgi:hypothetical protein